MNKEVDFSIDYNGELESHEVVHGQMLEEDVQDIINRLVRVDVIPIGERTNGTMTFTKNHVKVWSQVFNSPDDSDYDEFDKEIETDKLFE